MKNKNKTIEKINEIGEMSSCLLERMKKNEQVDIFLEVYKMNQRLHELKKAIMRESN